MEKLLELYCLQAPTFALDGGALFGVVPKVLWERENACDELNRVRLTTRCLYLKFENRRVLIDPGIGDCWDERFMSRYSIQGPSVLDSLELLGVKGEDITDVILTHLHFDHVGGCFSGDPGALEMCFPNATHWVQETQWNYAHKPTPKDRASFIPEHLEQLANGELELIDGECELFKRVRCIPVDGHTFSQQLIVIKENDGSNFLYGADLYPLASILNTSWVMAYDIEPLQSITAKQKIVERFADKETFLILTHEAGMIGGVFKSGKKSGEIENPMLCEQRITQLI